MLSEPSQLCCAKSPVRNFVLTVPVESSHEELVFVRIVPEPLSEIWLMPSKVRMYVFNKILDRVKRIWYLSPMRAAKVQASLRICAVSPEPPLLAHISNESRGTFRQKARSLAPLNGWACVVKCFHDGMLEDTNSLDGAQMAGT